MSPHGYGCCPGRLRARCKSGRAAMRWLLNKGSSKAPTEASHVQARNATSCKLQRHAHCRAALSSHEGRRRGVGVKAKGGPPDARVPLTWRDGGTKRCNTNGSTSPLCMLGHTRTPRPLRDEAKPTSSTMTDDAWGESCNRLSSTSEGNNTPRAAKTAQRIKSAGGREAHRACG